MTERSKGPPCGKCRIPLAYMQKYIAILLQNGNEEILNLCYCGTCNSYYFEGCEDVFISSDEVKDWLYGPYNTDEAKKFAALIEKCPDPSDKHCQCDAHKYFYGIIYGR